VIVRPRPTIFNLFFILRGSILPSILPRLVLVFTLSMMIVLGHAYFPSFVGAFDGAPFALVGIALSVFLGSRNTACYDRWWEARKSWGLLMSSGRGFARATLILGAEAPARRRLLTLTIAFAQAMVPHLRNAATQERAAALLPEALRPAYLASRNGPDMILREIAGILAAEHAAGRIGDIAWQALDGYVRTFGEMQAACERIRQTPVPFGYTLLLHRTAFIFCLLLPFGFVNVLGFFTPLASTLVAYAIFGLDALGDELERPFGGQPNDLPIAALADTLEINLREALGETDLAPLPVARDFILL
jgi:putative membrane protein